MSQWYHNNPDFIGTYEDYVNLQQNHFAKLEIDADADEKGHIEEEKSEREKLRKIIDKLDYEDGSINNEKKGVKKKQNAT
jgi:hypothetical protein